VEERLAIVGSGAIACGIAAVAARHGRLSLWARTDESADRARERIDRLCSGLDSPPDAAHAQIFTDAAALDAATFVIEAIVEDADAKRGVLQDLAHKTGEDVVLATTTSSLPIAELADASGASERFVGLHVFNPVTKMKLVELGFPPAASAGVRTRTRELCEALGKTAVEVPTIPGFVVNRLLFPYLFDAVLMQERTGMAAADIDTCMQLGAGHPMGPLALLDLVGLDVARAIGEAIELEIPPRIDELIAAGALGRKSGRGFHSYD
jgi:3-hydroxybutyryl-CoA dehydrogenase